MGTFTNHFKSKLKAYFIQRLGAFDYRNGWMKCDCPECGKELKYGINLSLNRTNCFRCGYNKRPLEVLMELEHIDTYSEAIKFLNDNKDFEGYEYHEERIELREHKETFLPEGFKLLTQGNSTLAKAARRYIKSRGFDPNALSRKGWGYATKGKYFGYIIIPFLSNGTFTYFNARRYCGSGPRYNNPETEVTGLGKSFIWYNHDALYMYRTIFLCEGAINATVLGDRAVASGGKFVSRYQINEIIKSPVERIIICLDSDAMDKAISLAFQLIDFKKVKVIRFPDGKDANDLGHKKTMKLIYNSRYLTKSDLQKMKNL